MWTTIVTSIVGLFTGQIPAITREIVNARVALANSKTEAERIASEERIKTLEAQRDVLVAESTTPWNAIARFVFLAPFAFYFWWVVGYDKIVCKWVHTAAEVDRVCTTDPLGAWLTGIAGVIIGFYFLTDLTKVIKR